jgi:hypothetical protein
VTSGNRERRLGKQREGQQAWQKPGAWAHQCAWVGFWYPGRALKWWSSGPGMAHQTRTVDVTMQVWLSLPMLRKWLYVMVSRNVPKVQVWVWQWKDVSEEKLELPMALQQKTPAEVRPYSSTTDSTQHWAMICQQNPSTKD